MKGLEMLKKLQAVYSRQESSKVKPSIGTDSSHINCLPREVLSIILGYLDNESRQNARLVCSSWYQECRVNVYIYIWDARERQYLEKIGSKCINFHLRVYSVDLPATTWKKIGANIRELELDGYRFGDEVFKNVILYCENLQILRVKLQRWNFASPDTFDDSEHFTSLDTLENLDIVRTKLKTLKIAFDTPVLPRRWNFELEDVTSGWRRIFSTLFRIFPCICRHEFMIKSYNALMLSCSFSNASGMSEPGLASVLACFMPFNNEDWKKAFVAWSAFRLTTIELRLRFPEGFSSDEEATIVEFFSAHKELQFVDVSFTSPMKKMAKSILFAILDHCSEIRRFRYSQTMMYWMKVAGDLSDGEVSHIYSKLSRMEEFSMGDFVVKGSSLMLRGPLYGSSKFNWPLIQIYFHIEHLFTNCPLTDEILQIIFQHFTRLKTLDISIGGELGRHVYATNFGLTGRRAEDLANSPSGYSIKDLQNLERLKIVKRSKPFFVCQIDDTVWYEFDFPKLRYLYYSLPENLSILPRILTKMPSLREIDFSQTKIEREFSDAFVFPINKLLDVSPNLKLIRTFIGDHYYQPFTGERTFRKNEHFADENLFAAELFERAAEEASPLPETTDPTPSPPRGFKTLCRSLILSAWHKLRKNQDRNEPRTRKTRTFPLVRESNLLSRRGGYGERIRTTGGDGKGESECTSSIFK